MYYGFNFLQFQLMIDFFNRCVFDFIKGCFHSFYITFDTSPLMFNQTAPACINLLTMLAYIGTFMPQVILCHVCLTSWFLLSCYFYAIGSLSDSDDDGTIIVSILSVILLIYTIYYRYLFKPIIILMMFFKSDFLYDLLCTIL